MSWASRCAEVCKQLGSGKDLSRNRNHVRLGFFQCPKRASPRRNIRARNMQTDNNGHLSVSSSAKIRETEHRSRKICCLLRSLLKHYLIVLHLSTPVRIATVRSNVLLNPHQELPYFDCRCGYCPWTTSHQHHVEVRLMLILSRSICWTISFGLPLSSDTTAPGNPKFAGDEPQRTILSFPSSFRGNLVLADHREVH